MNARHDCRLLSLYLVLYLHESEKQIEVFVWIIGFQQGVFGYVANIQESKRSIQDLINLFLVFLLT